MSLLSFFSKKDKYLKAKSDNSYVKLRRKSVLKRVFKAKWRIFKSTFRTVGRTVFKNKLIKILFFMLSTTILIVGAKYFFSSPTFDIRNINISGNKVLEKQSIESALSYLIGRNIFLIRASKLQQEVEVYSPYIRQVRVEKKIPDTIDIFIEERNPNFIWVNLAGVYLSDDQGVILEVVDDFDNLQLLEEDVDLLKGYGDLSKIEEEEGEKEEAGSEQELDEEEGSKEVSRDEMFKILEGRRREIVSRVDHFWDQELSELGDGYRKYPLVFSYEEKDLGILDSLDSAIMSVTQLGISIDFLDEEVVKYIWEGDYRFVIYLARWRKIIFSTQREFEEQIEDLRVLLVKLKQEGKNFGTIDLSSEIIMYELDT